jgi:ferrous iron transport protein A
MTFGIAMSEAAVLEPLAPPTGDIVSDAEIINLGALCLASVGDRGVIARVSAFEGALPAAELERRLLELGFVEGATIEVLQEGLFGRDPIAVKLDDMRVAIRRREAAAIQIRFDPKADA